MTNAFWKRTGFVLAVVAFIAIINLPADQWGENKFSEKLKNLKITLGLDLAGGTELDYKIDLSEIEAQNADEDVENDLNAQDIKRITESVRDALEKRVNPAGVGEIIVKSSTINKEHHVLIQMPPSSNVAIAKQDAQKDNRLQFFEEDPSILDVTKGFIGTQIKSLTAENWDEKAEKLADNKKIVLQKFEGRFEDEVHDAQFKEFLFKAEPNTIFPKILDTKTEMIYTIEDGEYKIEGLPEEVLAIVKIGNKYEEEREKDIPEQVEARHILFAFPGAMKAAEDVKYQTEEAAKAKAEEVLAQIKAKYTELEAAEYETEDGLKEAKSAFFTELAMEYSTEGAAQVTGGNLGKFGKGQMIKEFEDACFSANDPKLLPEIVRTDFGFHLIEVLDKTEAATVKSTEMKVEYEILGWKTNDLIWIETALGGAQLEKASVSANDISDPIVNLNFNTEGAKIFGELTGKLATRKCDDGACRLGIKVGGQWISQPTVRERINSRTAQITGMQTFDQAKGLANGLNLGAIKAPVILSGETTIKPDLGIDQLNKSLKAAAIGFALTILFMILFYRVAGLIAGISLLIYAGLFVVMLKTWPGSFGGPIVLSLSGMAGIALSIGLAVDGNILIFERIKEEIRNGKSAEKAMELGFEKAWSAIRDSNLTTLLVCFILF